MIESGGAFVGPTQDHIVALAEELKVPTFMEYNDGKSVYNSSGLLGRQEYDGTVPPDPLILPDAAILQVQLDQWASEIDVDAPWTHPRAKEWDSMTLGDYVRSHSVNANGHPDSCSSAGPSPASAPTPTSCRCCSSSTTSPARATRPTRAPSSATPRRRTARRSGGSSAARS